MSETSEALTSVYTEAVGSSVHALAKAIENKLVSVADLDPTVPLHRELFFGGSVHIERTSIPERFLKAATPTELVRVLSLSQYAATPSVKATAMEEILARLKANDIVTIEYVTQHAYCPDKWPAEIAAVLAPVLSDLDKTDDGVWERNRRNLPEAVAQQIAQTRTNAKRKRTLAEIAAGQRQRERKSDPLLAALDMNDVSRMRGLDIEHLKPERWEKAKADWLKHANVEIRAHLIRLPLDMVRPHLKTAMESVAAAELNDYQLRLPKRQIPKDALKTLDAGALGYWFRAIIDGRMGLDAPITKADLDELSPILVMAELSDGDLSAVMGWLNGLQKARRVMRLYCTKPPKARPTKEEAAMLESVDASLTNSGYYQRGNCMEAFDKRNETQVGKVIDWLLGMKDGPETERLAPQLMSMQVLLKGLTNMFGEELSKAVNFAEDI